MAKILDGKKLSAELASKLEKRIKKLSIKPKLVIIQVGNEGRSNIYIKNKISFGRRIGAIVEHKKYENNIKEQTLIKDILKLNKNSRVHGIIVQLPIAKHLNQNKVLEAISPEKDVDALTPANIKSLYNNDETFIPATAKGVLAILSRYKISLKGKHVVLVGESRLVGRPTALALLNRQATVTVCHSSTKNLEAETRRADILITAAGRPRLISKRHVARGQIVIDIGISVDKEGRISGDVDFKNVSPMVRAITPVPGGVGPMTVSSLFENLLDAYKLTSSRR